MPKGRASVCAGCGAWISSVLPVVITSSMMMHPGMCSGIVEGVSGQIELHRMEGDALAAVEPRKGLTRVFSHQQQG